MSNGTFMYMGELLVDMGWLDASEVEEAISVTRETDQHLGHVLIVRGRLTGKEAQSFVLAQSLLRDGYISKAEARRALTVCSWTGLSLEDSLLMFVGQNVDDQAPYENRLGQLLIGSECVDAKAIEDTLPYCKRVGIPLGRALMMRNYITKSVLQAALEAQKLVRAKSISRENAIKGLATIRYGAGATINKNGEELPLGGLLIHAGIIAPESLSEALEAMLAEGRPLGQALLATMAITPTILEIALELQKMLRTGRIKARRAIKVLNLVYARNITLHAALAAINDAPGTGVDMSVALFLKHTGLFQERLTELDSIEQSGLENRDQLQFLSGFVTGEHLAPAVRCAFLVRHSLLSFEQALLAYHFSLENKVDVDVFLSEVGWVEPDALARLGRQRSERSLKVVAA